MNLNNKRDIGVWQFFGFATVSLLGTLSHYLYDWSGSRLAALISGVNESTWEHMKLLFFPMLLFAIVQSFFVGKGYESFWWIKLKGTLLGLVLIPVIFYTLRGTFGTTPDWINIAIFFVAAAIAFLYETQQFDKGPVPCKDSNWALLGFCLLAIVFWIFTFLPPALPLFQDPIRGSYSI